jgi:hypothetical protein
MSRLNLIKGVGPVLQIAGGAPPCPTPCTTSWTSAPTKPRVQGTRAFHLVRPPPGLGPFKDVYSVMAAWGANHGAEAVYRPSYWNAFGMVSAARPNGRAFDPFQSEHAAKRRTRKARITGRAKRSGQCTSKVPKGATRRCSRVVRRGRLPLLRRVGLSVPSRAAPCL